MSKLIKTQLRKTTDISKLVKKFISAQTDYDCSPLSPQKEDYQHSPFKRNKQLYPKKVSLSDWRALFNSCRKVEDTAGREVRQYRSQRKFDVTQSPFYTNANLTNKTFRTNKKYTPQKTSTSFRQSNLQSAIVQNFYEEEYIKQRNIQTAKIKKHYQQNQDRPISFNLSTRKSLRSRREHVRIPHPPSHDREPNLTLNPNPQPNPNPTPNNNNNNNLLELSLEADELRLKITKKPRNSRILNNYFVPQKYETVRINKKYIRRHNQIVIEGEKRVDTSGLRFYGVDQICLRDC